MAKWVDVKYVPAGIGDARISELVDGGYVVAFVTLSGSISYSAHALGKQDRGYATERQAQNAARRILRRQVARLAAAVAKASDPNRGAPWA